MGHPNIKPFFVGVAGGSACGKGTVVNAILDVVKVGDFKGKKTDPDDF
jgi:uridine kinase